MYAPLPLFMNRGSPPTALNARTGLLTPPGITFCARANNFAERVTFAPPCVSVLSSVSS